MIYQSVSMLASTESLMTHHSVGPGTSSKTQSLLRAAIYSPVKTLRKKSSSSVNIRRWLKAIKKVLDPNTPEGLVNKAVWHSAALWCRGNRHILLLKPTSWSLYPIVSAVLRPPGNSYHGGQGRRPSPVWWGRRCFPTWVIWLFPFCSRCTWLDWLAYILNNYTKTCSLRVSQFVMSCLSHAVITNWGLIRDRIWQGFFFHIIPKPV